MESQWRCNLKTLSIYSKRDQGLIWVSLDVWYTHFGDIKFRHPNSVIVVWKKNSNIGALKYMLQKCYVTLYKRHYHNIWVGHLHHVNVMSLFSSVLPSFHLSVHPSASLSVHLSFPSQKSTTIHHMIFFGTLL